MHPKYIYGYASNSDAVPSSLSTLLPAPFMAIAMACAVACLVTYEQSLLPLPVTPRPCSNLTGQFLRHFRLRAPRASLRTPNHAVQDRPRRAGARRRGCYEGHGDGIRRCQGGPHDIAPRDALQSASCVVCAGAAGSESQQGLHRSVV